MRVQSFKNGVRLTCDYSEFIQLRMALSARSLDLKQLLEGSENPDESVGASYYLEMCRSMYHEMLQI